MARSIELQRFYARKDWMNLRQMLIIQRLGICARCGKSFADDTSKLIGHHIIELDDDLLHDPTIALNQDNVELLCWKCHNLTHGHGSKHQEVFIVWGAPLAGKTTYIQQQAAANDIVVDMDNLWQAISFAPRYEHPDVLKSNVFALRDTLIDHVRVRVGRWSTAWVIGGYPHKSERERLASRLGAGLIEVEATREDCLQRAEIRFTSRPEMLSDWKAYINRWFDEVQR